MKKILLMLCSILLITVIQAQKSPKKPTVKVKPPVASGIYYIVNAGNGKAMEPDGISSGMNVFCQTFEDGKDGQQWDVKWNGKHYLIMPRGKADLFLQPHPSVKEATAIISINMGNGGPPLAIAATADSTLFLIKCLMNGGTNFFSVDSGSETQLHNTHKQMGAVATWRFVPVKD
jgi:hypothetical protein